MLTTPRRCFPKGTIDSRNRVARQHDARIPTIPIPINGSAMGDRTVDEMGHAWMNVTYITDEDYKEWAAFHKNNLVQPTATLPGPAGTQQQ